MEKTKLVCVLAGALLLLAGCGSGEEKASPAPTSAPQTETQVTTETEVTPATTVETETDAPPEPLVITITVRDGRPVEGIARPSVRKDDEVLLVVRADVTGDVHLHGYDLEQAVRPGEPARIRFQATIPGRFEIELHAHPELHIGELTVRP